MSEQGWVVESQGQSPAVLFHVPHAGTHIPFDMRADIVLDDAELEHELRVMTDWHTDEIEPMAAIGMGAVYLATSRLETLRMPDPKRDPLPARPGVCIGVDDLHTPPELVEAALSAFEGVLGDVGINSPFAGTYVLLRHYGRDDRFRSVMVEIRRDIYMDESTGELHAGIDDVVRRMSGFVRACASIP